MRKTPFTKTQIVSILKQQESGRSVKNLAGTRYQRSNFLQSKAKYGDMEASNLKNMKDGGREQSDETYCSQHDTEYRRC